MTSRFTTENIQTVFTYPFQDGKWRGKLTIAVIITFVSFLIVPAFFFLGYLYEIMRRIIVDKELPSLPDWDETGRYFQDGLKMFLVYLVYAIPSLVLTLPFFLVVFLPALISGEHPDSFASLYLIGIPLSFGLVMLGSVIGIVFSLFAQAGIGHMIAKGELSAAFRVREWWPIFRANLGGYLLSFVLVMGFSWIIGFALQFMALTIVLCFVLPFLYAIIYAYTGLVNSALYAQAYLDGAERLGSGQGIKTLD